MPERDHGSGAPSQLCSTVEDHRPAGRKSEAVPRLHVLGGRDETVDGSVSHNVAVECNHTSQLRQTGKGNRPKRGSARHRLRGLSPEGCCVLRDAAAELGPGAA